MAFPSTSLLDNFNRADNASLGGNWTSPIESGDVNPQILSNAWLAGGAFGSSYWSAASFGTNQEVWVAVTTTTTTRLYLCVGGGSWYRLEIDYSFSPHQRQIRYWNGSAYTTIATTTGNITSPEAYGFEKIGTTLTGYVRVGGSWSSLVNGTDSNLSSGNVGIGCYNASLEDFAGGDVVVDEVAENDRPPFEQIFNDAAALADMAAAAQRSSDGAVVLRNGDAAAFPVDIPANVLSAQQYAAALSNAAAQDVWAYLQTLGGEEIADDGATPASADAVVYQDAQTLDASISVDIQASATQTQGGQTLSADVDAPASIAAAQTQGGQSLSADVDAPAAISATQAQGAETISASVTVGSVPASVDAAQTQGVQSVTASAAVSVAVTATQTQGRQALTAALSVAVSASATQTQGAETVTASSAVAVSVAATQTQGRQSIAAAASVAIVATSTQAQGTETLTASVTVGSPPASSDAIQTQGRQSLSASASAPIVVSAVQTQVAQRLAAASTVAVTVAAAQVQGAQSLAASVAVAVTAAATQKQGSEYVAAAAIVSIVAAAIQRQGAHGLIGSANALSVQPVAYTAEMHMRSERVMAMQGGNEERLHMRVEAQLEMDNP